MTPGRVLGAGAVLVAIALAVVLTHSERRVTGSNFTDRSIEITIPPGADLCQGSETIPERSGALSVRLRAGGRPAPPLKLTVGTRSADLPAGWADGDVTIPFGPGASEDVPDRSFCILNGGPAAVAVRGQAVEFADPENAPASLADQPFGGRIRIDYLTAEPESHLSSLADTIEHFGTGKARHLGGTWTLLPIGLLTVAAWAIAALAVLRAPTRTRSIAAACAGVALANALAWSLLTPPLHVPDEVAHYAYAQHVVETGRLPADQPGDTLSPDTQAVTNALNLFGVVSDPHDKPIRSGAQEAALRAVEDQDLPRAGAGEALSATGSPPLYHLLAGAAYAVSPWDDMLDRLALMRLVSALLAAATAAALVLFLRELLPATPLATLGGGLFAAFLPLFGFMSGGVNNDALLYFCAAALFAVLARAFRRGMSMRLGLLTGAVLAVGLWSKLTFLALMPGALIAAALLLWDSRRSRAGSGHALAGLALAALVGAAALGLYELIEPSWRSDLVGAADPVHRGPRDQIDRLAHIWRLYLPALPGIPDAAHDGFAPYKLWFVGLVGRFGWVDYTFPGWVNQLALIPATALALLAANALRTNRPALRARVPEAVAYLAIAAPFLFAVGYLGYGYRQDTGEPFEQARYLLALLPLIAGAVALAVRGAGRHAHALIAALVVSGAAHTLFSFVITVERYYL